jgi:hypothetical protein
MADKFNLDGFAVDENNVCTAEGGFSGSLTGKYQAYSADGVINVEDNVVLLNNGADTMTLADSADNDGLEMNIQANGITATITTGAITVTLDAGEYVKLISVGGFWTSFGTTGVIS